MNKFNLLLSVICAWSSYSIAIVEKEKELELYTQLNVQFPQGDLIKILNTELANMHYASTFKNEGSNTLTSFFPELKKLPYINLATLPTPVMKLDKLSNKLNTQVYIKRDDLTHSIYGGNKVRKLGYLLGQALQLGAKKVLTFGCAGSNHSVATTVHARGLGLETICMLKHQPTSRVVQQNLLMHLNQGTELHFSPNNPIRNLTVLGIWLEHFKKDGSVPYIIPTGGSNVFGTIGFVDAAFELREQIRQGLLPEPTHIYIPCGSCATTAGILLGCKVAGLKSHIVAIAVEPEEDPTFAQMVDCLFKETNQYLHDLDSSFPLVSYDDKDLTINLNFTGPDYGVFIEEGTSAAQEMLNLENIKLEGTYTAKACAGLLADIKNNPTNSVLFWNTYSSADLTSVLANRDYTKLPKCFHDYFDEKTIQPLDHDQSLIQ
jgi:D-cysteine desulfhydrase